MTGRPSETNAGCHSDRPASIEAEQQALGTLMLVPDAIDRVGFLAPHHFYDPVHADIMRAILAKREAGELVSPVTLRTTLGDHEGLRQLGGIPYLARLAGCVISISGIRDTALSIVELAARRDVVSAAEGAIFIARSLDPAGGAKAAIEALEGDLDAIREYVQRRAPSVGIDAALARAMERMQAAIADGPATPTGIASLDRMIGGLYAGDMMLLGGRPSMGKTALAQSMARRIAARGRAVIFASLEMQSEDLVIRMASEALRERGHVVPYRDVRQGTVDPEAAYMMGQAAVTIAELPVWIIESHVRRLPQLIAEASRLIRIARARGQEIGALILDYIGLIQPAHDRWQSDNQRVAHYSQSLKGLAGEHAIPLVALSQLNRGVEQREDRRPQLSDLRDSGSLEQDADSVLFTYREEYYLERAKPTPDDVRYPEWLADYERARGRLEVIVAKQRMGPVGTVGLLCDLATNSIWDDHDAP